MTVLRPPRTFRPPIASVIRTAAFVAAAGGLFAASLAVPTADIPQRAPARAAAPADLGMSNMHPLPPRPPLRRTYVTGPLDTETVEYSLQYFTHDVVHCRRNVGDNETVAVVKWVINPKGGVTVARALGADRLSRCIATAMSAWQFAASKGGGITIVTHRFAPLDLERHSRAMAPPRKLLRDIGFVDAWVEGPLYLDELESTIARHRTDIERCSSVVSVSETVAVKFKVDGRGLTYAIDAVGDSPSKARVGFCIEDAIGKFRIPLRLAEGPSTVQVTFKVTPQGPNDCTTCRRNRLLDTDGRCDCPQLAPTRGLGRRAHRDRR